MIQPHQSTTQNFRNENQGAKGPARQAESVSEQVNSCITRNPKTSVLIGLGVGFGAGILLASVLRESSRHLSREDSIAERLGNQVMDSLSDVLPSSWMKSLRS